MRRYVVECQELGVPYLYDPSQQIVRMTGEELCAGIEGAEALFVNDYEFALVERMTGITPREIQKNCKFLVVTRGDQGASVYAGGEAHHIPAIIPEHIADPTGVGDAFRGGFLAAYAHALDWLTCGRVGVLAASYCLEQSGPQGQTYSPAEFIARYRRFFDDDGRLDVLLPKDA
jgi:adenosine kinase